MKVISVPWFKDADCQIWRIAGPSILSNVSTALIGIVDTWAIGHLSEEAPLAGLATGAFVITMIYVTFGFVRMGTTGLAAQAFGANRRRRLVSITLRAIVVGAGVGLLILALSDVIASAAISVWTLSGDTATFARTYLDIRLLGAPAYLVHMGIVGFLIGTQRARTALLIELILNSTNVLLTLWFVIGLDWGVAGAARASVIAEWLAALSGFAIVIMVHGPARVSVVVRQRRFWRLQAFYELTMVNVFILLRTLFLEFVFALLSITGGRLGDDVLAANHILLQLVMLASLGLYGVSSATQALVGAAKGAGSRAMFHFWSRRTAIWALLVSFVYAIAYGLAGKSIVASLTDVESVRAAAYQQIHWFAFLPLIAVWSYQLDGIFIGATGVRPMMWGMSFSAFVFVIAWWQLVPAFGNDGLWAAFIIFFAARALSLAFCYPGLARLVPRV